MVTYKTRNENLGKEMNNRNGVREDRVSTLSLPISITAIVHFIRLNHLSFRSEKRKRMVRAPKSKANPVPSWLSVYTATQYILHVPRVKVVTSSRRRLTVRSDLGLTLLRATGWQLPSFALGGLGSMALGSR